MKFEHKFEYTWGGEDNWYTKSKRWANKQNPVVKHLALGVIEWLWVKWIAGKVKMETPFASAASKNSRTHPGPRSPIFTNSMLTSW